MGRLERLQKELEAIERDIEILKQLRPLKEVLDLRRRLFGRLSFVKRQIAKLESSKTQHEKEKQERSIKANKNRSAKNKKNWRFWKNIQQNYYPDKSLKEIRAAWKRQKQALETDIPDVVWRNPSP